MPHEIGLEWFNRDVDSGHPPAPAVALGREEARRDLIVKVSTWSQRNLPRSQAKQRSIHGATVADLALKARQQREIYDSLGEPVDLVGFEEVAIFLPDEIEP